MLTQVLANSAVSSDEKLVNKRGAQQSPVMAGHDGAIPHAGTCLRWRRWCSVCPRGESISQKCSALSLQLDDFPGRGKKDMKKEQVGVKRDKRMNCQRPPEQV